MAWPILGRMGWWVISKIMARQAARTATSATGRQALSAANGLEAAIQAAEMAKDLVEEADKETGEQDITCPTGTCAEEENQKKKEEQERRLKELEKEADVKQRTKGRTKHGEKSGGMNQAEKDFDNLEPDNVKDINTDYGKGKTGKLADGRNVTVRPGSSEGPPTLEIRSPRNKRGVEIRYED